MAHKNESWFNCNDLEVGDVLHRVLHYFIVIYWSTLNIFGYKELRAKK
jgi:hypothetical protein